MISSLLRIALVTSLLGAVLLLHTPARGQSSDAETRAAELLAEMSVSERVGQLFLVTFPGDSVTPESTITDLILNYNVGSVVLRPENDNISGRGDTALQLITLTNELQELALIGSAALITETTTSDVIPPTATPLPESVPVPLLVAIQQEGDGAPLDSILRGVTQLPSPMAIGATWDPAVAEVTGRILGEELSALGINLLLGPSLDVLTDPDAGNDLGVRAFGGHPYWVGKLGEAYVAGVHAGSESRVGVVAKHFPGFGNSDRPLGQEIATVRGTVEELAHTELAPFAAVTGLAGDSLGTVDGLLTTHVRYQDILPAAPAGSAPISFDPQALQTILALPEFSVWRQNGGIVVSDSLGAPAVQGYYDDTRQEFPHRRIAKDALFAGNDLLYIADFGLQPASAQQEVANLKDTINWFRERYQTDLSFRSRADEAVLRILKLKIELYGDDFGLDNVLVDPAQAEERLSQSNETVFAVAQQSISRVSATQLEPPSPPALDDRIVIFTDVRQARQCSGCPPLPYISVNSLEDKILALYGPEGSDQVQLNRIRSFSFADLETFLLSSPPPGSPQPTPTPTPEAGDGPTPTPGVSPTPTVAETVEQALGEADWIIFAMLDVTPEQPASDAPEQFLAERPDLVRNRRVVAFAYNAPYYLDTTEVSKLTALYTVYSKIDTFVDASVRALFQESPLAGAPPVDIPSIGYALDYVTQPAPEQIIELYIEQNGTLSVPAGEQPLEVVVGEELRLRTGVILDRNGNPVPDGTLVQFVQQDRLQGFTSIIGERPTVDGVAQVEYVLEARTGQFRITAMAGEARNSQQVDIIIGENVRVVVVTLTPAPTSTSTPTATPTVTPSATARPTETPTPTPVVVPPEPGVEITLTDFSLLSGVFVGLMFVGLLGLVLARSNGQDGDLSRLLRLVLLGLLGGLLLYNYYALQLPGSELFRSLGNWAALVTTVAGGLLGLLLAHSASRLETGSAG